MGWWAGGRAGGQAFGHLGRRVGWQAGRTTGRQAWMLAGMYMSTHARARGALTPASLAWRGTRGSSRASSCRHSDPSRRSTEHGTRDSRSMPMACAEGISGLSVGEQGLGRQCIVWTVSDRHSTSAVAAGAQRRRRGKFPSSRREKSMHGLAFIVGELDIERRGPTLDMCTHVFIDSVGWYVSTMWAGMHRRCGLVCIDDVGWCVSTVWAGYLSTT